MALETYRAIADAETDPNAPLTSRLFKALNSNFLATLQSVVGAPRQLSGRAFAPINDDDIFPILTVSASDAAPVSFDQHFTTANPGTAAPGGDINIDYTAVKITGSVRLNYSVSVVAKSSGSANYQLRIYKNGVEIRSATATAPPDDTATTSGTIDVSLIPTDVLTIRLDEGGFGFSSGSYFVSPTASDAYVSAKALVKHSDKVDAL